MGFHTHREGNIPALKHHMTLDGKAAQCSCGYRAEAAAPYLLKEKMLGHFRKVGTLKDATNMIESVISYGKRWI